MPNTLDRRLLAASWRGWIAGELDPPGPYALQWLWTLLLCAGVATVFTLLSWMVFNPRGAWGTPAAWAIAYGRHLVVCLTIGATIQLLYDLGGRLVGGRPAWQRLAGWQRTLFMAGVPLLGVAVGWPAGLMLAGYDFVGWVGQPARHRALAGGLAIALLSTFAIQQLFAAGARRREAEHRATEAQLRLLQGQMEPHFLFNTLANVDALIDSDPEKSRRMLQSFTEMLRASLGQLRRDECPLDDELVLAGHFLRLMQFRMEQRLRFTITASDAARRVPVPPLLLQPLVENAVVHGLEPRVDGGAVTVDAAVDDGRLVVTVRDEGRGAPPTAPQPGNGIALANLHERLRARYGGAATLDIQSGPTGTTATLRLPARTPT